MTNNSTPHNRSPRFNLKSCPRCKGDMQRNSDHYGDYLQCFQCGFLTDIQESSANKVEPDVMTGNYPLFSLQAGGVNG